MTTRIIVRPLRARDYGAIGDIEKGVVNEYLRYLTRTGKKDTVTPSLSPAYFRHYLKMGCSFVAEVADKVVGYILAKPTSYVYGRRKSLWLEFIAVLPDHRRQGIGSRLIVEVDSWARKKHCEALFTTLNPNNRESEALLTNRRFQVKNWLMAEKVEGRGVDRSGRE